MPPPFKKGNSPARAPRRGARCKLTTETERLICEQIAAGATLETASVVAGIGERTLREWRSKGREERRGVFASFNERVEQALALCEIRALEVIGDAGKKYWQATAWLLERRFPDRWARPEVKAKHYDDQIEKGPKLIRSPIAGPPEPPPEHTKEHDHGS